MLPTGPVRVRQAARIRRWPSSPMRTATSWSSSPATPISPRSRWPPRQQGRNAEGTAGLTAARAHCEAP